MYARSNDYDGKGCYLQWKSSQYYIKLYDKGRHYERQNQILRFELKTRKSAVLKEINYLNDLLVKENYLYLANEIEKKFKLLNIVDALSPDEVFSSKEKDLFAKGINPLLWSKIGINRTTRMRFKNKFNALLKKYELDSIKERLIERVSLWKDQICNEFTDLEGLQRFTDQKQNDTFLPLYIMVDRNNTIKKCCPVSGIDISNQKANTKFASPYTIKGIYYTDQKRFKLLKHKFSNSFYHFSDLDQLSKKIWKGIKNKDSNAKVLSVGLYYYEQSLFPNLN